MKVGTTIEWFCCEIALMRIIIGVGGTLWCRKIWDLPRICMYRLAVQELLLGDTPMQMCTLVFLASCGSWVVRGCIWFFSFFKEIGLFDRGYGEVDKYMTWDFILVLNLIVHVVLGIKE